MTFVGNAETITRHVKKTYDVVYSSHLLEDFPENKQIEILKEWAKLLKNENSIIILCLPDQKRYELAEKHPNPHHKVPNFGLEYLRDKINTHFTEIFAHEFWNDTTHVATSRHKNKDFNFIIVLKKP